VIGVKIRDGAHVEVKLNWVEEIVQRVASAARENLFWQRYFEKFDGNAESGLHLAVLKEPYLQFILKGEKTIESRFSNRRCAPYKRVEKGDVVILKRQSGPVLGLCRVSHAWFYELDRESWQLIRKDFTAALRAEDPGFWRERESASFATLMSIDNVHALPPISCGKRDRRGWVILSGVVEQPAQWNLQSL
jgi:hypothetical protein